MLATDAARELIEQRGRPAVALALREVLDALRAELLSGTPRVLAMAASSSSPGCSVKPSRAKLLRCTTRIAPVSGPTARS